MEAAIQAEYHIDLIDFYRGKLTLRKLATLICHLPAGNAIDREIDPEAAAFVRGEVNGELLATIGNTFLKAHFEQPTLIETPGTKASKKSRDDTIRRRAMAWKRRRKERQ